MKPKHAVGRNLYDCVSRARKLLHSTVSFVIIQRCLILQSDWSEDVLKTVSGFVLGVLLNIYGRSLLKVPALQWQQPHHTTPSKLLISFLEQH